MHPKKKKTYQSGGMADFMKMMQGGMVYAENGNQIPSSETQVTGAKTSRLTPEEVRQFKHLYEKFGPFLRTEDFRSGFGGNELYRSIEKYAKEINKDVSPRAIAALAQLAMDSDGVPVNPLNVDELEYSMPEKKLMMGNGGTVKYRSGGMVYADEGTQLPNGDPEKPSFFIAKGYDNRGDMPSGRQIAALFVRTPDGPKQINPIDLMEYFPDAKDVFDAYRQAGIPIQRGNGTISFPQLGDDGTNEGRKVMTRHNRALMQEFGVDNMDALMDTLNIAPVQYKRERDLPAIVPGYDPRSDY